MKKSEVDILIIGAGPVGLLCAYLASLSGLSARIIDRSEGPLKVGRADALNARTLQLLKIAGLFDEIYPLGKPCNTSSVWKDGKFISRDSSWWDSLEGCEHKHFLMLGQAYLENILDQKLTEKGQGVERCLSVSDIRLTSTGCETTLSNGDVVRSRFLIGADGSRSFVRNFFKIPFEITRPELTWAVVDAVVKTDFPKVPEIINFQTETSDVAWIPREGELDRFYVRMDKKEFSLEEVLEKINRAISPHKLNFKKVLWSSQFSVKESVADQYSIQNRVFLAGDSCHIHSVNGGQGLNTGLGDAFNLIWKMSMFLHHGFPEKILETYEEERKPVAQGVIETSGELVRATKHSYQGTHALDYVQIVQRRAGFITGMGVRYGSEGERGERFHDIGLTTNRERKRIYSLLDYQKYTLFCFCDEELELEVPNYINVVKIRSWEVNDKRYWNKNVLVSPDSYIVSIDEIAPQIIRDYSLV